MRDVLDADGNSYLPDRLCPERGRCDFPMGLHFMSSSAKRRISGATFSRSCLAIRVCSGYARATKAMPTSPMTIPGMNHGPIQTMVAHIPRPKSKVPRIPAVRETAALFLETRWSSLRSCSSRSRSLGVYF